MSSAVPFSLGFLYKVLAFFIILVWNGGSNTLFAASFILSTLAVMCLIFFLDSQRYETRGECLSFWSGLLDMSSMLCGVGLIDQFVPSGNRSFDLMFITLVLVMVSSYWVFGHELSRPEWLSEDFAIRGFGIDGDSIYLAWADGSHEQDTSLN